MEKTSATIYKTLGPNSPNIVAHTMNFTDGGVKINPSPEYNLEVIGDTLYFVAYIKYNYNYESYDYIETTYTNDLDTWSGSDNEATTSIAPDLYPGYIVKIFKIGSTVYFAFIKTFETADSTLYIWNFSTLTQVTTDTSATYSGRPDWSMGYVDGSYYYYFYKNAAKTFKIRKFNGTSCSDSETLTSTDDLPDPYWDGAIIYPLQTKKLLIVTTIGRDTGVVFVYSEKDELWVNEVYDTSTGNWQFIHENDPELKITGFNIGEWNYKIYNDGYAKHIYLGNYGSANGFRNGMYNWISYNYTNYYELKPYSTKGYNISLDISDCKIELHKGKATISDDTYENYWTKGEIVTLYDHDGSRVVFEGFVDDFTENESSTRKVILKSPWKQDLERKVTYTFSSSKTTDEILETITPETCAFMGIDCTSGSNSYQPDFKHRDYESILKNYAQAEGWTYYVDYENMNFKVNDGTESHLDYKMGVKGVVQWGNVNNPDLDDWTDSSGADCEVSIVDEVDGHRNVMELDDQSGTNRVEIYKSLPNVVSAEISLWIRTIDVTKRITLEIRDGGYTDALKMYIDNSYFKYYDSAEHDIVAAVNDTWYHLKITLNPSTWSIIINNVNYGPYNYRGSPAAFDLLFFYTNASDNNYKIYIDAIGFSWDGYVSGSNKYLFSWDHGAKLEKVKPIKKPYFISEVFVYGAFVSGERKKGYARASVPNSANMAIIYEPNETDQTKLDTMAQAIIDKMENMILTIEFKITGKGCIPWGEQIDFDYSPYSDRMSELGSSAKYFVEEVTYWPLTNQVKCVITDVLRMKLSPPMEKMKERLDDHEELINQIESKNHWTWRDPSTSDFDETTLTDVATTWLDLDLSSIVGNTKKLVSIWIRIKDGAVGSYFLFRTNGHSNTFNRADIYTQVASGWISANFIMETDEDGKIEYYCNPKPGDWTDIDIVVRGYRDA
ncbi:MAG: hypothetical protein ACTSQ8_07850 [Candidatus Helarchaeota archaeon]